MEGSPEDGSWQDEQEDGEEADWRPLPPAGLPEQSGKDTFYLLSPPPPAPSPMAEYDAPKVTLR